MGETRRPQQVASGEPQARREPKEDLSALGPAATFVNKREELARLTAERKDAALASRGAPRRMSEEERKRKLEQMEADARKHEQRKDDRIEDAHRREKEREEKDAKMRATSDQSYFQKMRKDAYAGDEGTMADRLKSQRHRRAKGLNDPLERDQ